MSLLEVATTVIAVAALIFSWLSYSRTTENEKQRIVDDSLFRILEINLQYPDFDKADFTNNFDKHPEEKLLKQYEIYAMLVWNFLERLYLYYGEKRIKKMEYWGAFQYWASLHYHWFTNPEFNSAYPQSLKKFVDAEFSPKDKNISSPKVG